MKIKTTMKYHLTLVRMAIIFLKKKSTGKNVEKLESLSTVGGHVKCCRHSGDQCGAFSKILK